ncbi:hypothetical protein CR152_16835 [Massilia violaceinigra]|uniref:Uncharacterized protein n=1 Tax=Massilia violaceinigra TaxID=2045208 RepID=A0A2D2DM09_9BURK|nr:hypothetical protein CR152_16835 [Massilia violaceinigra]
MYGRVELTVGNGWQMQTLTPDINRLMLSGSMTDYILVLNKAFLQSIRRKKRSFPYKALKGTRQIQPTGAAFTLARMENFY